MNRSTTSPDTVACAAAAVWLAGLTATNLSPDGAVRGTLFYAVPVLITAWRRLDAGFLFAGVSTLSAWFSGAMAHPPAMMELVWMEGLWVFLKLSAIALGFHAGKSHAIR